MPVLGVAGSRTARAWGFAAYKFAGQQNFTTPGTYTFVVPIGVTSISMLSIGGGAGGPTTVRFTSNDPGNCGGFVPAAATNTNMKAGGGGALAYVNNVSVTPGESLTIVVGAGGNGGTYPTEYGNGPQFGGNGGESYVARGATKLVHAGGGSGSGNGNGGTVLVGTGGAGGAGGTPSPSGPSYQGAGGGGAGGYSGTGGAGGNAANAGSAGSGGAGGGGAGGSQTSSTSATRQYVFQGGGGAGGGTGLLGSGSSGAGGALGNSGEVGPSFGDVIPAGGGGGGSSGTNGASADGSVSAGGGAGGYYGGGGGSSGMRSFTPFTTYITQCGWFGGGDGREGAVRLIWSTNSAYTRSYPSTNTGNTA